MYIKVYSITREYYLCIRKERILLNSHLNSPFFPRSPKTHRRSLRRLLLSKSIRIEYSFCVCIYIYI